MKTKMTHIQTKRAVAALVTPETFKEWEASKEKLLYCDQLLADNELLTDDNTETNINRVVWLDDFFYFHLRDQVKLRTVTLTQAEVSHLLLALSCIESELPEHATLLAKLGDAA